jgi:mannose/fructose/N-acetylgalactosamine-specific phosphotransferase system component IIC
LFLFIFGTLFTFLLGVIYTFVMKGGQPAEAAKIIGICLATIIGTTFFIIDNQYFVTIFENTVGYKLMTMWKNTRDTLQSIFCHKSDATATTTNTHIFPGIHMVMTFMLSVFYMNNFGFVLQQIGSKESKYDFTIIEDNDSDHIRHLAKCVVRKHTIGHLCWVYFSAIVATMISTKYLAKMG